jgi:hypothetical protein
LAGAVCDIGREPIAAGPKPVAPSGAREIVQVAGALLAALGKVGLSSNVKQPNLIASRQLDQMHELKLGERAADGLYGKSRRGSSRTLAQ